MTALMLAWDVYVERKGGGEEIALCVYNNSFIQLFMVSDQ